MSFALRAYELLTALAVQVNRLEGKIDKMTDAQTHLDTDVAALTAGLSAVEAEIAALKAQPVAASLDFTGLDAAVGRLQGDVPAAPAPTPPVDPTPSA